MSFRTLCIVVAIASIASRCRAFMLDFSWYHSIDSSNVVECRVRTAVFHGGNDRPITTRRCEAYVEVDGDSHGTMYDIPHWIIQKYHREFHQHERAFLRIEGARFARQNSTERVRVARRSGDSHDQILVDVNAKIEIREALFENEGTRRRTAVMIGESNVLVVRVTTNDGRVALNASSISARVFGSIGTPASQYKSCSMGQKQLLPAVGPGINDGVLELKLSSNIRGLAAGDFENAVNAALATKVASLNAYDHIVYCLPAGSFGASGETDWIAYAYIDWNRAFFNEGACGYLSSFVHELGHNMGLGHSGKDGAPYGDQSGIMGIGYDREYWPLACFNSAKNWQLGWYSDKAVELEARSGCGPWKGRLYGFPDFASVPYNGLVLIKIGDIFIQYNKIAAMNRDTQEKANMVAFTQSTADLDSQSWSLDGRNSGTFQYESLCVDICGMFLNNGLEYVDVVVRNCTHGSICSNYYTPLCSAVPPIPIPTPSIRPATPSSTVPNLSRSPTTTPPIRNSSNMPTTLFPIPSSIPVPPSSGPTHIPGQGPTTTSPAPNSIYVPTLLSNTTNPAPTPTTLSPTINPTKAPTTLVPTSNPTPVPTPRPSTLNPTKLPSFPPTPNPTPVPTLRPPTMNPSKPPTLNPTKLPTIPPTQVPTTRTPNLNSTKSPAIRPTPVPTARPFTQNPTMVPMTPFSARNPTLTPTIPTRDMICDDNLLGVFPYPGVDGFVRERDCIWLRARPQMWGAVCSRSSAASNLCKETCGKCVDNCSDTTNNFLFQGFQRSCVWLSVRLGVMNEVCNILHEAYTVCPETCGVCDVTPSV